MAQQVKQAWDTHGRRSSTSAPWYPGACMHAHRGTHTNTYTHTYMYTHKVEKKGKKKKEEKKEKA